MGGDLNEKTSLVQLESGARGGSSGATFGDDKVPQAYPAVSCESGTSSSSDRTTFAKIAVGAGASLLYISLSASMILFNKHLMRPDVFPFPVTLTTLHMVCSLCLGLCLQRAAPQLFPAYSRVFARRCSEAEQPLVQDSPMKQFAQTLQALLPFAPIAACGAICLVAGNAAYKHASVSFLQVVKESHVMFVYILSLIAGLEKFKLRTGSVLLLVTCAAMVAVYGEVYFSWHGLSLQLVAGLAGSLQIVLNSLLMTKSSLGKIDPLTLLLCTAPMTIIALIPVNFMTWDSSIPELLRQWAPYLACNALLAFALQVSATTLIWLATGTGYALACVTKDLVIVAAAQVILHECFTGIQILGFSGSVGGLCIYTGMKLFPEVFEPAAKD